VDISDHVSSPDDAGPPPRFLKLIQVGQILGCSDAQVYALVRHGTIPAIKVGGRGQWRIETCELECAIEKMYRDTAQFIADHPFGNSTGDNDPELD